MDTAHLLAFAVGFLSTLHCIGMCGGIVGALSFAVPHEARERPARLMLYVVAFNVGRIASYAILGALAGLAGAALAVGGEPPWVLRWLAASLVIGLGLYIGGWFPRFVLIERLGSPVWRWLEPWGRRLLPIRSAGRATLFGAVWGWLPCGLVYSMLLSAPAAGGAGAGALYMAAFGVGTLPVMIAGGLFAGRLHRIGLEPRLQGLAGLLVIALGLLALAVQA